jgi:hypothetical protein
MIGIPTGIPEAPNNQDSLESEPMREPGPMGASHGLRTRLKVPGNEVLPGWKIPARGAGDSLPSAFGKSPPRIREGARKRPSGYALDLLPGRFPCVFPADRGLRPETGLHEAAYSAIESAVAETRSARRESRLNHRPVRGGLRNRPGRIRTGDRSMGRSIGPLLPIVSAARSGGSPEAIRPGNPG